MGITMDTRAGSRFTRTSPFDMSDDEPTVEEQNLHLLLVEDERDLQEMLRYNLARQGYRVTCADDGEAAVEKLSQIRPDLVLLDLMLPGMDGLEVCRLVKADPGIAHVPIIMLTARSEERDVVRGLEFGADDYVTKPFSMRLLIARIKAVLRRQAGAEQEGEAGEAVVRVGDLVIHPERHEVRLSGDLIDLTPTEFRLLRLLASRPGRVFSRQQIITSIHGAHVAVTDRSVDVQVLHLRRKLGQGATKIEAVRGVGYRFKDE